MNLIVISFSLISSSFACGGPIQGPQSVLNIKRNSVAKVSISQPVVSKSPSVVEPTPTAQIQAPIQNRSDYSNVITLREERNLGQEFLKYFSPRNNVSVYGGVNLLPDDPSQVKDWKIGFQIRW